ncbi:FHA domain-containing protein [Cryobacterium frigoriphilum]|uniref:FHA domain-containing protein n=1 Tax=Cryobacterium frigoriphilum TaxID=1259150 RepID=A0A4R9AAJ9_9MICO|nr:FHA domain-containing protein [Cryobacterium frigoriphilum]TFD55278.1 FHA domain-containing protein [Cryobacterium frigoriphilum]
MSTDGFIVPPPGLFPQAKPAAAPPAPVIEGAPPAAAATAPPRTEPTAPISIPSFRSVPLGSSAPRAAAWHLDCADGQSVSVTGVVLLGRQPAADAARPGARLLAVADAATSVSKTHAVVEVDRAVGLPDTLWVTDLHSTNGVMVTAADGTQFDLEPGGRAPLTPGSKLFLGEFLIDIRWA